MNSSYFNAMAGAFLTVVFVVMTVSIAADAIFHTEAPEAEGYALVALEGSTEPAADSGGSDTLPPIAPLLASADVEAGEKSFRKCVACHTVEEGGANRVGPNLWNIVNKPVATVDGFGYSTAMTDYADGGQTVWGYEPLNRFLAAPKSYIKGTAMGFAGLRKEDERADVIAYLRSLSDNPAPLPDPAAAQDDAPMAGDTEPANAESETAGAQSDTTAEPASEASETTDAEPAADEPAATDTDAAPPADGGDSADTPASTDDSDTTPSE